MFLLGIYVLNRITPVAATIRRASKRVHAAFSHAIRSFSFQSISNPSFPRKRLTPIPMSSHPAQPMMNNTRDCSLTRKANGNWLAPMSTQARPMSCGQHSVPPSGTETAPGHRDSADRSRVCIPHVFPDEVDVVTVTLFPACNSRIASA